MSLVTNLQSAFTRVGTEFKAIRTLISGSGTGNISGLTTTDKTSLVAAINEVKATAGSTNLDGLSDVTITSATGGDILRNNGSGQFVNVQGGDYFQPLDSDLTAIAALATTSYGRNFLALADQTALMGLILAGSTAAAGKLQLATTGESQTGTDTAKASTPAGVKAAIDQRIINDSTLASGSTTNAPSVASVKAYADALIGSNDAMVYKGVINASTNPNYPAADAGHTYRISVAGKIGGASGPNVEVGDMIICIVDGSAAGNHATVGANWNIVQANVDGAVTGPASSTSGNLASFNGTGGKVIQDSGFSVSSGAVSGNSATAVPTQSAVVTYAQPLDGELTAIAGLTSAADRVPYFTGSNTASLATLTSFGRSLIDDADATAARTTLNAQQLDATLTALAGLTTAADQVIYATGVDTFAMSALTTFGRSLIDDADAATARATLSVYSTTDIGDPNTDFVAGFVAALA